MELLRGEDSGAVAETWLESRVKRYQATSLFLPAGETPKVLYARWRTHPPAFLSGLHLRQVDDVAEGPKAGLFAQFFRDELPSFQVAPPSEGTVAELAILGLGPNGHIAFHEPHLPKDFQFGRVQLEDSSCQRLGLAPGTHGITYGAGAFLRAKAILLLVKGANKKAAFDRLLQGDPLLPASTLLSHPDLSAWTDLP